MAAMRAARVDSGSHHELSYEEALRVFQDAYQAGGQRTAGLRQNAPPAERSAPRARAERPHLLAENYRDESALLIRDGDQWAQTVFAACHDTMDEAIPYMAPFELKPIPPWRITVIVTEQDPFPGARGHDLRLEG